MTISINKTYRTRSGLSARVISTNGTTEKPVVAVLTDSLGKEFLASYRDNGRFLDVETFENHALNLIEVSPYESFKKDDPVMVKTDKTKTWVRRHFSHVNELGEVICYPHGHTSFTSIRDGTSTWKECRRPTEEELSV